MTPFLTDTDLTVYIGEAEDVLYQLPNGSVDMIVTSPPYWGLRDYGTGAWVDGDENCQHRVSGQVQDAKAPGAITNGVRPGADMSVCIDCGALRIDEQLGLEATPEQYVKRLGGIMRRAYHVLKQEGTLWLNLGASYYSASSAPHPIYKPKDLVPIPWLVAMSLQRDGWWLRMDNIWHKPDAMPSPVTDRPTLAHEYVLLLSRSQGYYFDQDAVREPFSEKWKEAWEKHPKNPLIANPDSPYRQQNNTRGGGVGYPDADGRNMRSVWEIYTQKYQGAHFATFPLDLVERCIKAGCPEGGTVLDPFLGSGTTAVAARKLGRNCIGIELNPNYGNLIAQRTQQLSLFT